LIFVCVVAGSADQVFLHLLQLLFFSPLLQIQQLHLRLKPTLLFSQTLVFEFFLLQLAQRVSRVSFKRARSLMLDTEKV